MNNDYIDAISDLHDYENETEMKQVSQTLYNSVIILNILIHSCITIELTTPQVLQIIGDTLAIIETERSVVARSLARNT